MKPHMHYVTSKGILSSTNNMNLYRGCTHGCIYCDARSECYHMAHLFEDIEVKANALELLENVLRSKRKKCIINMGSMTDPYIPLESKLQSTRGALELIERYGFGGTLITKSDLLLRDIEVFKRINDKTKFVMQMTLTTYDDELCKIVEPNVCTTSRRAEALRKLRDEGIPTVIWMTPLLPFINDTVENVRGIVEIARDVGAYGIITWGMGMTLRSGNREYYYKKLDEHFPGLKERYIREYGDSYELTSNNSSALMRALVDKCEEYGIKHKTNEIFEYLYRFEDKRALKQISLWDV